MRMREHGENVPGLIETIVLKKDGSSLPVYIEIAQLDLPGGPANVAFLCDISERKQAEEALKESESKYRAIFETTGSATIIVEKDTTISLANKEFAKLSGYSKEEVEGRKSWAEFFDQSFLEKMKEYHWRRRIASDAAPRQYETELIDRHGAISSIIINVSMIPGTQKSVATLLNITGRKQAEERFHLATEVLENVSSGILVITAGGTVHYVNPAFTSITGYDKEGVAPKKWLPTVLQSL